MMVHFTTDKSIMNIFLFPGYVSESDRLQQNFAANVIPFILRNHFMDPKAVQSRTRSF